MCHCYWRQLKQQWWMMLMTKINLPAGWQIWMIWATNFLSTHFVYQYLSHCAILFWATVTKNINSVMETWYFTEIGVSESTTCLFTHFTLYQFNSLLVLLKSLPLDKEALYSLSQREDDWIKYEIKIFGEVTDTEIEISGEVKYEIS